MGRAGGAAGGCGAGGCGVSEGGGAVWGVGLGGRGVNSGGRPGGRLDSRTGFVFPLEYILERVGGCGGEGFI